MGLVIFGGGDKTGIKLCYGQIGEDSTSKDSQASSNQGLLIYCPRTMPPVPGVLLMPPPNS